LSSIFQQQISPPRRIAPLPLRCPPATQLRGNFSVDSTDKFLVSYHCKGKQDVAAVVCHINGVLRDTNYPVSIVTDRKSVSWQNVIQRHLLHQEDLASHLE
jgi:hypothetical protein